MARLRCACGIDSHAHGVPEAFPAYLGRSAHLPWPGTAPAPTAERCLLGRGLPALAATPESQ